MKGKYMKMSDLSLAGWCRLLAAVVVLLPILVVDRANAQCRVFFDNKSASTNLNKCGFTQNLICLGQLFLKKNILAIMLRFNNYNNLTGHFLF